MLNAVPVPRVLRRRAYIMYRSSGYGYECPAEHTKVLCGGYYQGYTPGIGLYAPYERSQPCHFPSQRCAFLRMSHVFLAYEYISLSPQSPRASPVEKVRNHVPCLFNLKNHGKVLFTFILYLWHIFRNSKTIVCTPIDGGPNSEGWGKFYQKYIVTFDATI